MRPTVRRSGALALLAALVAVPTGLPAAAQSSSPSQITQRHSILTELGSTGDVSSSRVFTQLTVAGDGDTTVTLPSQSTRGLRSLDGFGGPEINGDDVVWNVRATRDGTRGRTVADNTAELPVDVQVRYSLNGREVEPSEIVGQSGRLSVTYTVTNLTAEPVQIHPTDARGERVSEEVDIAVPMVGSLALTLPPTFTNVDARGANVAGDGRGNTVVNFSLLLFAPLGDETQEVTYHANVTDAAVPGARIQVLPVDESSFTSLRSTSLAYRDAVDGTQRLGYGAQIIDTNVLKLADGAAQLLDGLGQLSDGADQLSDGLVNAAAPGARELADGLQGRAAPGARELADGLQGQAAPGARQLSEGLGSARSGGGQLAVGLSDLSSGANRLSGGAADLDAAAGQLGAGAGDLATGAAALQGGLNDLAEGVLGDDGLFSSVLGGIEAIRAGAVPILSTGPAPTTDPTLLDGLTLLAGTARSGATPPTGLLAVAEGAGALARLNAGLYSAYQGSRDRLALAVGATQDTGRGAACFATGDCTIGDVLTVLNSDPAVGDLLVPGVGVPYSAVLPNTVAGLKQVHEGLDASLAALGEDQFGELPAAFASCTTALAAVQGETPTGLESLLAAACISRSLDEGINGDGGANPGAAAAAARLRDGARDLGLGLDAGLDDFASQVRAGERRLQGAFGAPGTSETLLDGAARLAGGAGQLSDGATRLRREGTRPLAAGAGELAAGAGRAASGGGALSDGLRQLDDGAVALAAGIGTAATGAGELADGIGDAADGAGQLADGLGDAADGSTQLAEGLGSAEDGGEQIADGSVRLSEEGMGALIDGISDAKLGASRNLESIKAVSNRGRSFDGPYGTAARADSSTVWQFEVAGVGDVDGTPSTTTVALLALAALGIAGGAGTFLRRRLV